MFNYHATSGYFIVTQKKPQKTACSLTFLLMEHYILILRLCSPPVEFALISCYRITSCAIPSTTRYLHVPRRTGSRRQYPCRRQADARYRRRPPHGG